MTAAEVTVLVFGGGVLRRLACALRIHRTREGPVPCDGPLSIRYCIWCGESDDWRWTWAWTTHRFDLGQVSLVRYREARA